MTNKYKWYEFLYPKKKTVLATIYTMIVWYALLLYRFIAIRPPLCKTCFVSYLNYTCEHSWPKLLSTCDCCFTAGDFFSQLWIIFVWTILPIIITYIFYASLFYKLDKK